MALVPPQLSNPFVDPFELVDSVLQVPGDFTEFLHGSNVLHEDSVLANCITCDVNTIKLLHNVGTRVTSTQ